MKSQTLNYLHCDLIHPAPGSSTIKLCVLCKSCNSLNTLDHEFTFELLYIKLETYEHVLIELCIKTLVRVDWVWCVQALWCGYVCV